ncbi:hypothetical protein G6F24_015880 [Rhizopus arrhizus]|nr:hypothetical protein G6F24_015880 [Rhizopus arrhizus]
MRCTGVAKSVTFIGLCRLAGSRALPTSTTTLLPCVRRSGTAPCPSNWTIRRPAPSSPRLKSIFATARPVGATAAATVAPAGFSAGVAASAGAQASISATPNALTRFKVERRMGRSPLAW